MDRKLGGLTLALLLTLFSDNARAEGSKRFGDWAVSRGSNSTIAETRGSGGDSLGVVCGDGEVECLWVLLVPNECDDYVKTPAMVSNASGTHHVTLVCSKAANVKTLLITPASSIEEAVKGEGVLSIVYPLEGGTFKVSRFSLKGSTAAIKEAVPQTTL